LAAVISITFGNGRNLKYTPVPSIYEIPFRAEYRDPGCSL